MQWEDLPESENVEDRRTRTGPPAYGLDENDTVVRNTERDDDPEQTVGPMFDEMQDRVDQQYMRRKARRSGMGFYGGGAVEEYNEGGEVGDFDEYAALGEFEDRTSMDINGALRAANEALMYGRKKYGLMGEMTQSFEDGGEVLDEGEIVPENSVLDMPMNSGAGIPFEGPEQPYGGNRVERAFQENVAQPVQQLGRRLLGYLQSSEADPRLSRQAEMEVDPEGVLDEDTRKLLAVQLAGQRGGAEASWRVLQDYRKKYDGYRAFAAAALQNQDLPRAARAASQAYPNILDGTSITFTPGEGGVTATIRPRGGEPQQLALSAEQFNRWLTGDEGQYDMVLSRGGPAALQALLARSQPAQPGVTATPGVAQPRAPRADPSKNRLAVSQQVVDEPSDDELLRRQFPWASQSSQLAEAQLKNRNLGREREARTDRSVAPAQIRADASQANAATRAGTQRDVAEIRAGSYDRRTQQVYDAAMARVEQQARRGQNLDQLGRERNAMRAIVEKLRNNIELTPQERQVHERIMSQANAGGAAAQQQMPAAPPPGVRMPPRGQNQQPSQRPPGAAFRDQQGRFYDKYGRPL